MSATTTYNLAQTVFVLSQASNGVSDYLGTQVTLQTFLTSYLSGGGDPNGIKYPGLLPMINPQLLGGDWGVVWGPCVYCEHPTQLSYTDNTMFVAYSPSQATYVVALGATDPDSLYDWVYEDGDVLASQQIEWPPTLPIPNPPISHPPFPGTTPAISHGTALGISNLLTQPAMVSNGQTLQQFLTAQKSSTDTLIICGHSLAGALSPTLALFLHPHPRDSGWKDVFVLPSAGATPGNTAFAVLYDLTYPATPNHSGADYSKWNVDYMNLKDVVPHAWNLFIEVLSLPNLKGHYNSIYGYLGLDLGTEVAGLLAAADALAYEGHYLNIPHHTFTPDWGAYQWVNNSGYWGYPPSWVPLTDYTDDAPCTTSAELGGLILAAHTSQYARYFSINPLQRFPTSPKPTLEQTTTPLSPKAARKLALRAAARLSPSKTVPTTVRSEAPPPPEGE